MSYWDFLSLYFVFCALLMNAIFVFTNSFCICEKATFRNVADSDITFYFDIGHSWLAFNFFGSLLTSICLALLVVFTVGLVILEPIIVLHLSINLVAFNIVRIEFARSFVFGTLLFWSFCINNLFITLRWDQIWMMTSYSRAKQRNFFKEASQ